MQVAIESRRMHWRWLIGLAVAAIAACDPARIGEPGGADAPPGAGGTAGSAGSGGAAASGAAGPELIRNRELCKTAGVDVAPSPLRRISRLEYNNMVRDLIGDNTRPADAFVGEDKVLAFNSNSLTPISELAMEQYFGAAEKLSDDLNLATTGCAAPIQDACAESYLERLGKRAFRGNFGSAERDQLLGLYRSSKTDFGDAETALRVAVRSLLVSPRFLYVIERGEPGPGPVVPLTQPETAARLALYFWRSVPDEELLAAADSGQLKTADQVATQARRLLADGRAQAVLEDFALQWLDLERLPSVFKDTQKYAQYSPELIADFRTETLTFFREFVGANATLPRLFTANFSFLNQRLAAFYGASGGGGNDFAPADLDPAQRSGILTQGSILAMQAHPTKPAPILRGKLVRERIFCQTLPMPPPDVNMNVPDAPPGTTTTESFRNHVTDEACARCHRMMDPIGFGFSNYDGLGKFVTSENGAAVDARGEVIKAFTDLDGAFTGAVELSKRIAESEHVKQCFVIQNFRYGLGRVEAPGDACSLQRAYDTFVAKGFTMTELMVALASSDAFRHRRIAAGGSCQ